MNTTLYPNITQTTGGKDVTIAAVMKGIKAGKWKSVIDELRKTGDKSIKQSLPYFTGSGTFDKRNDKGLKQHNGRIIIDIDKLDKLDEIRTLLCADSYTEHLFVSCSGNGLAVVVKIDGNKHKESFLGLQAYYLKTYGINVDKACKDVSRPRYVSYDPDLYSNPKAEVFTDIIEQKQTTIQAISPVRKQPTKAAQNRLIKRGVDMFMDAPDGEKHSTLLSAANLLGGYIAGGVLNELDCVTALTQAVNNRNVDDPTGAVKTLLSGIENGKLSPLYDEGKSKKKVKKTQHRLAKVQSVENYARELNKAGKSWTNRDVDNCGQMFAIDGDKIRAIFNKTYDKFQDEFDLDNQSLIIQVEHFLNSEYDFRFNEVKQETDYKKTSQRKFAPLNDNNIYRALEHADLKYPHTKTSHLLRSDFVESYHPFKDYFNNLEEVTADEPDYIAQLAAYIKTEDQTYFVEMFRKALVRCIACSLFNQENRIVFVLVGEKQGTGKSTFIRYLNPFGSEYFTEEIMRDDKDTDIALCENFIYNLDELSSLSTYEINKLKAKISSSTKTFRKPYARNSVTQPRRCNFFGSTNRTDFLSDTENTRWICFEVIDIDFAYTAINIKDVWRSAWQLYNNSYNYQLTKDEADKRDVSNTNYEVIRPEAELILKHYRVVPKYTGTFLSNTDIMLEIGADCQGKIKLYQNNIGKSMRKLGFENDLKKINGDVLRGYYVGKITDMERANNADKYEEPPF